jgi:nicotinamide riboside kinase
MTQVVNLFGGSGIGKSTTAAGLYSAMKLRGLNAELVREFVKGWAWDGIKVGKFDQIYILGKQAKTESRLYGKVDWIVTDSPLLLSPIYERFWNGHEVTKPAAFAFMEFARSQGVKYHHFLLSRSKPYDPRGRYETEEQALRADVAMEEFLINNGLPFKRIVSADDQRVTDLLKELNL